MSGPRRPGGELDGLRSAPILVATPTEVESERARLVPWLEREIAALPAVGMAERAALRAERRRRVVWGSGALTAAAGLGLVLFGAPFGDGAKEVPAGASASVAPVEAPAATLLDGRLESGSLEVLPGSRLGDESRFRTSEAVGARLLTAGGATLAAAPGTEFALSPGGQTAGQNAMIQLSHGSIDFAVPKLEAGRTFRVKTTDALVTVVGTRFFVTTGANPSEPTCVRVEEGSVRVERAGEARLLGAGQAWGCDASSGVSSAVGQAKAVRTVDRSAARASRDSQLDQQNRLLATALAAERQGDVARARAAFDELVRRHPDSPFGPEARAGLARLKGR